MMLSPKSYKAPYLAPIIVHNGLLRGYAFVSDTELPQVDVLINGKPLTKVFCKLPIPKTYQDAANKLDDRAKGFLVPLPAQVFDGAPHELTIRLCLPGQSTGKSATGNPKQGWLIENKLTFQFGDRHGHVNYVDHHFQGWVAFNQRPTPLPQLTLCDQQGNCIKEVPLIPLPAAAGQAGKYLANFRIPRKNLPIPLWIHCGGTELTGSPCEPSKKLAGFLERFDKKAIRGWAFDMNKPADPVELTLKIDNKIFSFFRPNIRRFDIARHLKLSDEELGIVGFQITPPEILFDGKPHRISVEFTDSSHPLRGSNQLVQIPKNYLTLDEIAPPPKLARRSAKIARPKAPLVSVIILNRNGETPLATLLESWKAKNSLTNIEFIIVDHASEDESLKLLNQWQYQLPLHIIPLSFNDSFSASCNRAAAEARGRFLLFLNNDIVWLQDALPPIVDALEKDQKIGALGLKLLKSTDDHEQAFMQAPVQHLGVRFKLSNGAYWPYEATNDDKNEAEYSAQVVPAVTAAAMLCRKEDFFRAGQFDPSYFYGFEDVEFCLRLGHKLNRKIVCRNDLVALHYHGHTRLSGRAVDIFDRLVNNANVLQKQVGLWLKRNYWTSLFSNDKNLTTEKLTIGFIIDEAPAKDGTTPLSADANKLARQVLRNYPQAQVVFLPPSRGWYNARNLHVLIVGHPEYDIDNLTAHREDLITLAWIRDNPNLWCQLPWWPQFDGYLAANSAIVRQLAPTIVNPIVKTSATSPLGPLFNPRLPPLRIALLVSSKMTSRHEARISELQQSLKANGAIVWQDSPSSDSGSKRLADVQIAIHLNKRLPENLPAPQFHTLNILWAPDGSKTLHPDDAQGWMIINSMPQVKWLHTEIEKALGNTFHPS
ncbi:glycosyltransferase family 2 protein [Nitrosomonas sp. Nm166]|uniref:glycosyltransferase family 2 protein n=1 Tax=Nitrosomonas sp. Nm166 TaxID=1881054 RepID=UPI0008F2FA16|nr:glycosyltransferase [Nitrosomonas sp. Nm166]SFE46981.1 Glycosyltransferase, GT2 family [Nitrosomonas sp. Nm166]